MTRNNTLLIVALAAGLIPLFTGCKSHRPGDMDVLPENGSNWNHNYIIVHPTSPEVVRPNVVYGAYPQCAPHASPQVPQPGVKPQPCEGNGWPEPTDECADGACDVPGGDFVHVAYRPGIDAPFFKAGEPPQGAAQSDTSSCPDRGGLVVLCGFLGLVVLGLLFKSVGILLMLSVLILPACNNTPFSTDPWVTESQLEEQDDRTTASFEAMQDKFNSHLAANPGDIEGAVGSAFGASVEQHKKKPVKSGPAWSWLEILGLGGGTGATLGLMLVRLLRGSSLRSGSANEDAPEAATG